MRELVIAALFIGASLSVGPILRKQDNDAHIVVLDRSFTSIIAKVARASVALIASEP